MSPERLAGRLVVWLVAFTSATAAALFAVPSTLLLLPERVGREVSLVLMTAIVVAGILSAIHGWTLVMARRRLLSTIRRRSRSLNQIDLPKLNDDPWHIVNAWVVGSSTAVGLAMLFARPDALAPLEALTVGLFSVILITAVSLPLLMVVRAGFVRVMERVPPDVMAEIIDAQVRSERLRGRTSRRLLTAMATPVAFLAVGAALIAGAHLRAADDAARLETAQMVTRGILAGDPENSGIAPAQSALAELGLNTRFLPYAVDQETVQRSHGLVSLSMPTQGAGLLVEFVGSTTSPVIWQAVPIALAAVLAAVWVGIALGRLLSRDLRMANHGVRMLGTDAALEGTRVMRPARFRAVAELGQSIELLANRFRHFAQAQERAITARSAATRARGRFFASVSHDLKSPLNAILGFAELCQSDPLTNKAQNESLDLIVRRGRELLALIETILDAARVEAGQLQLSRTEERVVDILEDAVDRARQLSSNPDIFVMMDVPDGVPPVVVDRLRFSQALASFIGHALKTAERGTVRLLVDASPKDDRPSLRKRKVTIHVEVPSLRFSAKELAAMVSPEQEPGQHRGVAQALRLAKSIVELHGGKVSVTGRTVAEPAFAIELRGRAGQ